MNTIQGVNRRGVNGDESKTKRNEIQGYSHYGRKKFAWDNSLENLLETVKQHERDYQWRHTLKFILPKKGMRVIDCGAGRCWASHLLAKKGCKVVAVDMNIDDVGGLGAGNTIVQGTDIYFARVCADLENLPFKENVFDLAFGYQFLHHAYSLAKMLNEISRVLKPKGRLVALNEHTRPIYTLTDKEFRVHHPAVANGLNEHAYHFSYYVSCLQKANLNLISAFPYPSWDEYFNRDLRIITRGLSFWEILRFTTKRAVMRMLSKSFQCNLFCSLSKWIVEQFAATTFSFIAHKSLSVRLKIRSTAHSSVSE